MSDQGARVADRLGSELGSDRVTTSDERGVAGIAPPVVVVSPRSSQEVSATIAIAREMDCGVVPVGGDTAPRCDDGCFAIALSTASLDTVIDHAVDDLVLTAGAGTTLSALENAIRQHGHRLPFSAPFPDRSTLGGAVACAAEGPTLHAYGATRDQVLGVEIVHGDGRITRAGGKVVKNVTGYDLCRLYTGSRGVLGIITEVTVRLRPVERSACRLAWRFDDVRSAWEAGMTLREHFPALFALHVVRGRGLDDVDGDGCALIATLRGSEDLVEALGEACFEIDLGSTARTVLTPDAVSTIEEPVPEDGAWLRLCVLPSDGGRLLDTLEARMPSDPDLVLDVFSGLCDVTHSDPAFHDPVDETALGADLQPLGAIVDRPSDPEFHLRRFHLFPSTQPQGAAIMGRLMTALDPDHILNPGRYEVSP